MATRYQMQEKLLSIGDDYWIDDESGNHVFRVNGKAMRIRQTFILEDVAGNEVAKIQERKLSVRDRMAIERDGSDVATVKKALVGIRDRFSIDLEDGGDLKAKGNFVDHEYEIEREGDDRPCLKGVVSGPGDLRRRDRGGRRRRAAPRDHGLHRRAFWPRVVRCFGREAALCMRGALFEPALAIRATRERVPEHGAPGAGQGPTNMSR